MRITTHLSDSIARDAKTLAENEKKSVSAVVAEAITYYVAEKKRKRLGRKVLEMAGRVRISPDVYRELEQGRLESNDRT